MNLSNFTFFFANNDWKIFIFFKGHDGMIKVEGFIGNKEEYCQKMRESGAWADHVAVMATAIYLKRDIMIVTSSPCSRPDEIITWIRCQENPSEGPLLLGHRWENHYVSLCPFGNLCLTVCLIGLQNNIN